MYAIDCQPWQQQQNYQHLQWSLVEFQKHWHKHQLYQRKQINSVCSTISLGTQTIQTDIEILQRVESILSGPDSGALSQFLDIFWVVMEN